MQCVDSYKKSALAIREIVFKKRIFMKITCIKNVKNEMRGQDDYLA